MADEPRGRPAPTKSMDPARQFDFWVGEWEVFLPSGERAGANRIELVLGDRVLSEHWTGATGTRGSSFSLYVADRGGWHQTWVDSNGTLLLLEGGLVGGAMVLQGTTPADDPSAPAIRHRISWSLVDADPDRVRQLWETSSDGGATWETAFDGRYRRVGPLR